MNLGNCIITSVINWSEAQSWSSNLLTSMVIPDSSTGSSVWSNLQKCFTWVLLYHSKRLRISNTLVLFASVQCQLTLTSSHNKPLRSTMQIMRTNSCWSTWSTNEKWWKPQEKSFSQFMILRSLFLWMMILVARELRLYCRWLGGKLVCSSSIFAGHDRKEIKVGFYVIMQLY